MLPGYPDASGEPTTHPDIIGIPSAEPLRVQLPAVGAGS